MRRGIGYLCVFLGGLFLLLGILAKPVIYHNLATVPLDQKTTLRSVGEHMTALEISKTGVRVVKDATLENYKIVLGIPGKAKGNNAFWQYVVVSKEVGGKVLDQSQEGVSFDRVSGEATNCCGDYKSAPTPEDVNATKKFRHAGLFFKFPFDTQKTTYQWWDGDLGRTEPMRYMRTQEVQGVQTYVFQQKSGPEVYGKQAGVPGELFHSKKPVDANLVYQNTRTLYVEPNTGAIIKGVEQQNKRLEAPGYDAVPTTIGTIGYTDATIKQNIKDSSKGSTLGFIKGPLTPIGIVLGLILMGVGGFLALGGSKRKAPTTDPQASAGRAAVKKA
jgi:Porin PorA